MPIFRLPEASKNSIRRNLGLKEGAELRVSYITGPGDVAGTYTYWKQGKPDPRVPIITYSSMFYDLMDQLDAKAQLVNAALEESFEDGNFQFSAFKAKPFSGRISYWQSQRHYVSEVVRHADEFNPHIIVAATHFPSSGWSHLAKGSRRVVLSVHNTFWPMGNKPTDLKSQIKTWLFAKKTKHISSAVYTSEECKKQFQRITQERLRGYVEIPQITELPLWEPLRPLKNLIYVGRIEHNKGVIDLLTAFKRVRDKAPHLTLTYVGDGSFLPQLKAAAQEVKGVIILGRLGSEGVHQALADSDLLICPTRTQFNEGLAVVGFEAAAHGIPSIQSSVVPAHETLGDACLTYEANNADDLRDKLESLLNSPERYAALKSATETIREKVMNRDLSWEARLAKVMTEI
jgi:glycosyltransferase involved in cell wall biosynthesis